MKIVYVGREAVLTLRAFGKLYSFSQGKKVDVPDDVALELLANKSAIFMTEDEVDDRLSPVQLARDIADPGGVLLGSDPDPDPDLDPDPSDEDEYDTAPEDDDDDWSGW